MNSDERISTYIRNRTSGFTVLAGTILLINLIMSKNHIEKFEIEIRQTKLGLEEVTRDLPNVSETTICNLQRKHPARSYLVGCQESGPVYY